MVTNQLSLFSLDHSYPLLNNHYKCSYSLETTVSPFVDSWVKTSSSLSRSRLGLCLKLSSLEADPRDDVSSGCSLARRSPGSTGGEWGCETGERRKGILKKKLYEAVHRCEHLCRTQLTSPQVRKLEYLPAAHIGSLELWLPGTSSLPLAQVKKKMFRESQVLTIGC